MIIWSGLGFLVILVSLFPLMLCELVFDGIYGHDYYAGHDWTIGLGLLLSAAAVYWLSRRLQRCPSRTVIDKATGAEIVLRRNDTLMAIPVRFWPVILAVSGLILCIKGFVR